MPRRHAAHRIFHRPRHTPVPKQWLPGGTIERRWSAAQRRPIRRREIRRRRVCQQSKRMNSAGHRGNAFNCRRHGWGCGSLGHRCGSCGCPTPTSVPRAGTRSPSLTCTGCSSTRTVPAGSPPVHRPPAKACATAELQQLHTAHRAAGGRYGHRPAHRRAARQPGNGVGMIAGRSRRIVGRLAFSGFAAVEQWAGVWLSALRPAPFGRPPWRCVAGRDRRSWRAPR